MRVGLLWLLPVLAQAGTVTVTPNNESVVVGGTRQMTATVSGLMSSSVTWSATVGSINATGMYTAPPAVPNPASVTITATSTVDPTAAGSAVLTIKAVAPVISSVNPSSFPLGSFALVV